MLWANGIITGGCCCGHNRMPPSVVLDNAADGQRAIELLRANDGRKWDVMQWQLVTLSPLNTEGDRRGASGINTSDGAVGLTPKEKLVLDHLALAWNAFVSMENHHPDDTEEMRRAIHAAQHIIASRVAFRVNPEVWRGDPKSP